MIKFKTLTIKNFMSVGAVTQTINLNTEDLNLIVGENLDLGGEDNKNGTGKSSILNALSYVLFDAALTKIRKDNLVNKTNGKDMFVSLEYQKGDKTYKIERGRKRNVIRFWVNNTQFGTNESDEAQGESRLTQKEIEKSIGMTHSMFKNIVALNTYSEPFLSMRANDQREIIEQLLGITKLSEKADVLKQLLKDTRDSIKEEEYRIKSIVDANATIEKNIKSLRIKSSAWDKTHEENILKTYEGIQELQKIDIDQEIQDHALCDQYSTTKSAYLSKKQLVESITKDIQLYQSRVETAQAKIDKSADKKVCHTCGSDLDDEKHGAIQAKLNETIDTNCEKIETASKELEIAHNESEELYYENLPNPKTFYSSVNEAYEHRSKIDSLESYLDTLAEQKNPYNDQIETLQKDGIQTVDRELLNELVALKDHQEFLLKLLTSKDSFIRKKIIDQNLNYLNSRLDHYLVKLGLPHCVRFLSDLTVDITEHGRVLDFDNLSRGERTRLIIGLSMSFRDVFESLNHKVNLLMIDELLDNGLDTNGVENSVGLLKQVVREHKKSVFLISHREELLGRVNSVVKVIKEGGFTSIEQDQE